MIISIVFTEYAFLEHRPIQSLGNFYSFLEPGAYILENISQCHFGGKYMKMEREKEGKCKRKRKKMRKGKQKGKINAKYGIIKQKGSIGDKK
jgi:hypothetical protein